MERRAPRVVPRRRQVAEHGGQPRGHGHRRVHPVRPARVRQVAPLGPRPRGHGVRVRPRARGGRGRPVAHLQTKLHGGLVDDGAVVGPLTVLCRRRRRCLAHRQGRQRRAAVGKVDVECEAVRGRQGRCEPKEVHVGLPRGRGKLLHVDAVCPDHLVVTAARAARVGVAFRRGRLDTFVHAKHGHVGEELGLVDEDTVRDALPSTPRQFPPQPLLRRRARRGTAHGW